MKEYLLQLLLLLVFSNFALAQNSQSSDTNLVKDPQVSDQNYKHPIKSTTAINSGKEQHIKANVTQTGDNSNYKHPINQGTSNKSTIPTPTPEKRKKDKRNYKHQF